MNKVTAILLSLLFVMPAIADTVEQLETEVEAQRLINALQRQRIETLEAELAGRRIAPPDDSGMAVPQDDIADPQSDRALERALKRRGSAVLAPGVLELTPSFFWSHSGSDAAASSENLFGTGFEIRAGLPGDWMLGAGFPWLHRDVTGFGDNTGAGDVSVTLWKSLFHEHGSRPSLVTGLRYTMPTGDNVGDDVVPLGDGFHSITVTLSAVTTVDPVAFFGDLTYTSYIDESIPGVSVDRENAAGFGAGVSLAVTPSVSLSAGLDFSFEDEISVDGARVTGSAATRGQFEISAGLLLTRSVFLNVFGSFGVTDDSPDTTLGVSLPVRF